MKQLTFTLHLLTDDELELDSLEQSINSENIEGVITRKIPAEQNSKTNWKSQGDGYSLLELILSSTVVAKGITEIFGALKHHFNVRKETLDLQNQKGKISLSITKQDGAKHDLILYSFQESERLEILKILEDSINQKTEKNA